MAVKAIGRRRFSTRKRRAIAERGRQALARVLTLAPDGAVPLDRVESDSSHSQAAERLREAQTTPQAPLLHLVEKGPGEEERLGEAPTAQPRGANHAVRGADSIADRRPLAGVPCAAFRPSRRQLLKTGAIAALGLWGAGIAGQWLPHSAWAADGPQAWAFFRAKDLPLVRAVVNSFLDWTLPADAAARQQAVTNTVSAADSYFSSFTPAVQAEALQALDLLNLAPARWLGGLWAPWEAASPADVNRFLEGLRTGRLSLSRQVFRLLAGIATVGWYGQPASWPAIGYPGPPNPPRPSGERPL